MKIEIKDILSIFEKYQIDKRSEGWGSEWAHDYYYIQDKDYRNVASEIIDLLSEQRIENAELSAKVKAYEAIIENSNFKTIVARNKK